MKINLQKLSEEGEQFDIQEPASILEYKEEGVIFSLPINVSVFVSRSEDTLLINGKVFTTIGLTCSRCTEVFDRKIESNDFNISLEVADKKEVDITEEIREEILLLIPVKPLCCEDCKGMCPKCGQNLNEKKCKCDLSKEDDRWSGLNKIKF